MAIDLNKFKQNPKAYLNEIKSRVEDQGKPNYEKDTRYFELGKNEKGVGEAKIRFLPPIDGEVSPFVQFGSYWFKGPGGWYVEKALTSIGLADPVNDYNKSIYDKYGKESPQGEQARKRSQKQNYVSNIYVINDHTNPENNGKVFLFKFGVEIFKILKQEISPESQEDE